MKDGIKIYSKYAQIVKMDEIQVLKVDISDIIVEYFIIPECFIFKIKHILMTCNEFYITIDANKIIKDVFILE